MTLQDIINLAKSDTMTFDKGFFFRDGRHMKIDSSNAIVFRYSGEPCPIYIEDIEAADWRFMAYEDEKSQSKSGIYL